MARKQRHNLGFYRLLTGDMGKLYPAGVVEVLPGDRFRHNATFVIRLSPMAAPVMHHMTARVDHFFVPSRIVWPKEGAGLAPSFEDFITGGPQGTESNPYPTMNTTGTAKDVMDYMGLPTVAGIAVASLPIRAYNAIYNEWYRDQDLVAEANPEDTTVRQVAWEKDYLSTSRPWPQKGPEVTLPLGQKAPVKGIGAVEQTGYGPVATSHESDGTTRAYTSGKVIGTSAQTSFAVEGSAEHAGYPNIFADLSNATAATINSLRLASALQRFAEARARFGSRYAEYVRRAFGARPLDARLQRPEWLGGGTTQLSVSEVLQTGPEPSTTRFGVGDMYGHGIGMAKSNRYTVSFSEHGYVLTLVSVRPKAVYSNGIDRMWLRRDKEDFYQPEFAHIGQQPVKTQEVWASSTNQDDVFGWSDRYAEYRHTQNRVAGEFRTQLNYWHLGREFTQAPALNQTFVECNPSKRIFNVTDADTDSLWMVCNHKLQALRCVPRSAVGRLL